MSWNDDQAHGERAMRRLRDRDERDRKLGAAVRAAVEDVADDRISGHCVADDAPDRIYISEDQLDVLRAIARVMREEAP